MPVPDDIIGLEETSTSGAAYEALRLRWRDGNKDRETALHLLFLAWDQLMEPPHLTGRTPGSPDDELKAVFNEAHEWLLPDGAHSTEVEALYVVGLVACLAPYAEYFRGQAAVAHGY